MTRYSITLDLTKYTTQLSLSCKNTDVGREIAITLHQNGVPYTLTADNYAVFVGKKTSGHDIVNDCVVDLVNNCVVYTITSQTIAEIGNMPCEIQLFGYDREQIGSPTFNILVRKAILGETNIESSSEYGVLNNIINDVERRLENGEFDGKDGINPIVRINETTREWEVSYDDGESWQNLDAQAEPRSVYLSSEAGLEVPYSQYKISAVTVPSGMSLKNGDIIIFANSTFAMANSVGERNSEEYSCSVAQSFKGDKGVGVPDITDSDNGKVLMADNGKWEPADIFPMYDLIALGLPAIPIDGDVVYTAVDTADIFDDMAHGGLTAKFSIIFDDRTLKIEEILHPAKAAGGDYLSTNVYYQNGDLIFVVILFREDGISAYAVSMTEEVKLKSPKELPIVTSRDNRKALMVSNGQWEAVDVWPVAEEIAKKIAAVEIPKAVAQEIEQRLPMQMLPTPILSLENNNNWLVHNISPDATMLEFWDGSLVYLHATTNGATAMSFGAPTDGKIRNVAVRVTADGYHPSAFSNTVVYPNLNDVMTEFVKTRRSLSRVYFPFYGTFPYNDINNRVKMDAVGSLGVHRSLPITDDSQNVIVPAINSAEKCLLLNGNDAGKQNRRLTFTRCKFINNDSVTASNALPDEMVCDPFPRKECTIEMWINSQTTRKGCLFASVSREDNGGTPNFYDFYWDTFNGQRAIILNMQTEKPQTYGVSEGIQILQIGGVSQEDKGWFHLVFTQEVVNGQTVTKIYVNGTLRERWTVIPLFHDCQTARAIYSVGAPCGDSGNCFEGAIHSFGIYDFVWTEGQVKAVYEAEKE